MLKCWNLNPKIRTKSIMLKEYEINLFGVDEFHKETNSRLRFYYEHIRKNLDLEGDIFEFGVYKGASLIAAALILKDMNSNKKVYGFDSFDGFPSYSKYDDLDSFYTYKDKFFSEDFLKEYEEFLEIKRIQTGQTNFDPISIATSGSFNKTSKELIQQKIDYFELDNIILVEGDFKETVPNFFENNKVKISSANIDCDLYDGYKTTLPFIYKYLSVSGYVHLDEYYAFKYPGAKIACDEFFNANNITPIKNKVRTGEFERWYFTKT